MLSNAGALPAASLSVTANKVAARAWGYSTDLRKGSFFP